MTATPAHRHLTLTATANGWTHVPSTDPRSPHTTTYARRGVTLTVQPLPGTPNDRTPFAYASIRGLPLVNLWHAPSLPALRRFLSTAPTSTIKLYAPANPHRDR